MDPPLDFVPMPSFKDKIQFDRDILTDIAHGGCRCIWHDIRPRESFFADPIKGFMEISMTILRKNRVDEQLY